AAHGTWLIASLGLNPPGPARVLVSRSPDAINWGNPIVVTTAGDADKNWIVCDNNSTSQFYGHCYIEWDDVNSGDLVKMNTSAEIDANGTVYVVWADCRFRTNCSSNDLVLSTSADGVTWTKPARIPIDPTTSTVDHFIPGVAVDPATSASSAHLTLTYYYYLVSNCGTVCQMGVAFVSSQDGGQTWSAPVELAGPMITSWLPNTFSGLMVSDYISTSYVNGNAFAVFAAAKAPSGSTLDEAMYTTTSPLAAAVDAARFSSRNERPVPNAKSDHGSAKFYDLDHEHPIPPKKKSLRRSARR